MKYRDRTTGQIVEAFQLHDGEDVDKTEQLHEFMGDYPWEGDESGVYLGEYLVEPGGWIVKFHPKMFSSATQEGFPKMFEEIK